MVVLLPIQRYGLLHICLPSLLHIQNNEADRKDLLLRWKQDHTQCPAAKSFNGRKWSGFVQNPSGAALLQQARQQNGPKENVRTNTYPDGARIHSVMVIIWQHDQICDDKPLFFPILSRVLYRQRLSSVSHVNV
ncbi:hypothetical protein SUGI_0308160 [Cryptomeria japonica]|nr:hypothetical protein SUGI_0308160 [Cryptomeria japonica]